MDINNINLSPRIIANLYPNTLIDTGKQETDSSSKVKADAGNTVESGSKQSTRYLGQNGKSILILVRYPSITHLPDEDLGFLTGILNACKLTVADVAIINIEHTPAVTYQQLSAEFSSRIMLLFSVDPESISLPMILPQYQLLSYSGNTFLYAPSLKKLSGDKAEKTKLWASLKKLFNI